jgi:hypothetical protein
VERERPKGIGEKDLKSTSVMAILNESTSIRGLIDPLANSDVILVIAHPK